jgi:hypothetical protein
MEIRTCPRRFASYTDEVGDQIPIDKHRRVGDEDCEFVVHVKSYHWIRQINIHTEEGQKVPSIAALMSCLGVATPFRGRYWC